MTYPVIADFRSGTLAEWAQGLALTLTEAPDASLTPAIARMVKRVEALCSDEFVSAAGRTYDLRGSGTSQLFLPARCTAVTTVKTRDYLGNLTTQAATAYRLVSSLDSTGAYRLTSCQYDYLEIPPYQYLAGVVGSTGYAWPIGAETIQVVGTFGWTVTPTDVNRCIALLVFDHFKPLAPGLRRAETMETVDARYTFNAATDITGITEADDIIADYRRSTGLLVG